MAFIKYLNPDEIPEANRVNDTDHILQVHGVHSEVMLQHYTFYKELMYSKGPLTRIQREMIAIAVSAINECHYWIKHHGAGLRRLLSSKQISQTEQDSLLLGLIDEGTHNSLGDLDIAILEYATKLTRLPSSITQEDIVVLRSHGLDDRGIHDICAITAYFAFVNRIADGLGVELEDRFSED